jgi:glycosyltransferase involved in cell wall biosynthesis
MHSLISFATQWGSKYGGINSFNTDFLTAFGVAYPQQLKVICIVSTASQTEIDDARNANVTLIPLPYPPQDKLFTDTQAQAATAEFKKHGIEIDPDLTVWLGHDRISGAAAIAAAKQAGGRSALIHHMSYDAYEAYAESSASAYSKSQQQKSLFQQADVLLAVGPTLQTALCDLIDVSRDQVHKIIPGLAEIEPRKNAPTKFKAFMSGRLSDDAARIKQAHLGVAAFSKAQHDKEANAFKDSTLMLRGVDFESRLTYINNNQHPPKDQEAELQEFAEQYANGRINLQALPYTQDRNHLYGDLKSASVALMPSWHEGFGLVAWEAVAAGVPLIVSKNSGIYELLHDEGLDGYVHVINVRGQTNSPYFHSQDLEDVTKAIKGIAADTESARRKAIRLKNDLLKYTWSACVENVAEFLDWNLQKGSPKQLKVEASVVQATEDTESSVMNSPLLMPIKAWRSNLGYSESQMLRADFAIVPFDNRRQSKLDELNQWLDDDSYPIKIQLLTGAGGLGKTRLAIELCQQRRCNGWCSGFLSRDDSSQTWDSLQKLKQPLLIVIDYAETRQDTLLVLLKAILKSHYSQPIRILLLARGGGEWWEQLPGRDSECEALLNGYATSGPYDLPELYMDEDSRIYAYQVALHAFAAATNRQIPNGVPNLSGPHFAKPLYLQMAALLALYGERPTTALGLTRSLLHHEGRYWQQVLQPLNLADPQKYAQDLLTLTTLSDGFKTAKEAFVYWKNAKSLTIANSEFNALFEKLVPLYPGCQGLQPVQPDLIGEALVAQSLQQTRGLDLLNAVLGRQASGTIQHQALTVIARLSLHAPELADVLTEAIRQNFVDCCQCLTEVAIQTRSRLPEFARYAFKKLPPQQQSQAAGLFEPQIGEESLALGDLHYEVALFLVNKSERKYANKTSNRETQSAYAIDLNTAALCARHLGKINDALDFTKKSVELFGRLAKQNSNRFEPNYATSLSNYASFLSDLGRDDEAEHYDKQALDIRQRLAQQMPDRFEPNYASSLNNNATRLRNLGRDDEAECYAKQALDIRQRLAQQRPDRFEPNYASSLNNYAIFLSDFGRDDEAERYAKQALDIYQRLAQQRPDRFEPDYAMSLNTYANRLSDLGRYDDAECYTKQALDIYQRLAQQRPDRFEPNYALSLDNYASRLSDLGRYDDAVFYTKQALNIYQRLAQQRQDRFSTEHFGSLCQLFFMHWLWQQNILPSQSLADIIELPATIPSNKQLSHKFSSLFVQGYCSSNSNGEFQEALAIWPQLAKSDQKYNRADYLCVCGWLNQHAPDAINSKAWLEDWQKYLRQRKNKLPKWMETVAKHLDFVWPNFINEISLNRELLNDKGSASVLHPVTE